MQICTTGLKRYAYSRAFQKNLPAPSVVSVSERNTFWQNPPHKFLFFVKSSPSARRAEHRFAAAHGHGPRRPPLEEEKSPSCVRDCCAISTHCWRLAFAASLPWPGRLGANGPRRTPGCGTPGDLRTHFPVILAVSAQPHARSPQLRVGKRFRTSLLCRLLPPRAAPVTSLFT
jgi:hypothetical protein